MKFRIGNHKLMIESGRFSQIPRVNRLCPTCGSNQIEDEIHLLFHCPKYSIFRDRFYRKLEYHLPYTAISRNVVGKKPQKTAQANPERYFG